MLPSWNVLRGRSSWCVAGYNNRRFDSLDWLAATSTLHYNQQQMNHKKWRAGQPIINLNSVTGSVKSLLLLVHTALALCLCVATPQVAWLVGRTSVGDCRTKRKNLFTVERPRNADWRLDSDTQSYSPPLFVHRTMIEDRASISVVGTIELNQIDYGQPALTVCPPFVTSTCRHWFDPRKRSDSGLQMQMNVTR